MSMVARYCFMLLALCLSTHSAYSAEASSTKTKKILDIADILKEKTSGSSKTIFKNGASATYNFSGATADFINYLRLCMATDNLCSSCGVPYATYRAVSTSGLGFPYTTTGTPRNLQASAIQSYLSNNGFNNGTYYVGLYVQSTNLVCNSNSAYCSTNQDNTGQTLCVQAVSNDGITTLTQIDNGNAALSTNTTPYLYVSNGTGGTVSVCPLNLNNTDSHTMTCSTSHNTGTPSASLPYGVAIDPLSANLYLTYFNASATNSSSCSISQSTGGIACSKVSFASSLSGSVGAVVDPPGQNVYVVNSTGSTVQKCAIGANSCSSITFSGTTPTHPRGIAIDSTNTYAYITDTSLNAVVACSMSGLTWTCSTQDSNQENFPVALAINNANTAIYIVSASTGSAGGNVRVCNLSGTTLTGCTNASATVSKPEGITLNPSGTIAYITNSSTGTHINTVSVCSINTAASPPTFSSCNFYSDSSGTFHNPVGIGWGNVVG